MNHDYLIARIFVEDVPVLEERITLENADELPVKHKAMLDHLDQPWRIEVIDPATRLLVATIEGTPIETNGAS